MTTNLQIGRCGLDVDMRSPRTITDDGTRITIAGDLHNTGDTAAETKANTRLLRDQLLGYVNNPDEESVPVVATIDTHFRGDFRVLDASVTTNPDAEAIDHLPFSVTLERCAAGGSVVAQTRFSGPLRTTDHGIVAGDARGFHGVPESVRGYFTGGVNIGFPDPIGTSDGVDVLVFGEDPAALYKSGTVRWSVPEENWYDGAARITDSVDGVPIVGRRASRFDADHPICRVSNGIITLTAYGDPDLVGNPGGWPTDATLGFEFWDGTAWDDTRGGVEVLVDTGSPAVLAGNPWQWTVTRNGPEGVAVRIHFSSTTTPTLSPTLDIMLRRGAHYAECYLASPFPFDFGAQQTVSEGEASLTGGVASDTGTADRLIIATPRNFTASGGATAGFLLDDTADDFPFAVGIEGPGATYDPQTIVDRYHQATTETQRIVAA